MSYPVVVPDWQVYAGDTFTQTYVVTDSTTGLPLNLAAWGSWAAAWRPYQGSDVVVLSVSTVGLASGQITVSATAAQTAAMDGPGVWDVQAVNAGTVRTWLRGKTAFVQDVTL